MSYGQGGSQSQWDPWKPNSQQSWNSGSDSRTPDWAALAEASETRQKRRRMLLIGGGAVAAVGIATAVAVSMASGSSDSVAGRPTTQPPALPTDSVVIPSFAPTSAPPPLDPKEFISDAKKDKAPLDVNTLFPGTQLTMGKNVYKKGPTDDTKDCTTAAQGTLPKALTDNGCTRVLRVTYSKDGLAVTVGVAVFDTAAQAAKAKGATDKKSIVKPLPGGDVKAFCNGAVCRSTTNSLGRYAYFTLTGFTSGKDVTTEDTEAFRTGDDLAQFTFQQILRRGETQASAAATQ
ncbi:MULTISPECIES: hypothetical protein [Streptomyces]|uniref:hypothetical protein n=2 Tax=Streptomyces TaxID=1883 RepID=UPI00083075FF|nr:MULTISPECIES: hypothetical protein [unclassified Streptomyces]MDN5384331.1 hypothetical protein [Streptomyces sp. LB8]